MAPPNGRARPTTPFPTQQMFILSLLRICEPISFTSIFPYIYQMIDSFGTAKSKNEIGVYAGMVTSAFALAEFSTGMLWGRISDRFGRKPVLIMGLVGTLVSMLIFGFAQSFPVLLVARALGGALNGNIGVIQTTVAELVTEKEHQPRAFAIMPFVWCLGSIAGPSLGGLLSEPTKYYPNVFPPGGLLEKYPYLLPNMIACVILVIGIIIGTLFLEETHEELRKKPDPGRILGQKLISLFTLGKKKSTKYEGPNGYESPPNEESDPLLTPTQESGMRDFGTENTVNGKAPETERMQCHKKPPSVTRAFNRPVIALIISYALLAYHTMGFEQLMPVYLATPPTEAPLTNPFVFNGGLGMGTQAIGIILTMQGIFSMLTQFFLFPPCANYFGTLNLYRFCCWTYLCCYVVVPYLGWLPENLQLTGIYVVLAVKIIYGVLSYPCNAILLTNSAPSLLVLGAINGVAASCASLARAFAPTITGIIYSKGLEIDVVGLAWWVNAAVCLLGGVQCLMLHDKDFEGQHTEELDTADVDEEAIAVEVHIAHKGVVVGGAEEYIDDYSIVKQAIDEEISTLHDEEEAAERRAAVGSSSNQLE